MSDEPDPFCKTLPTQLRAWDATSLRAYQECPRKYQYAIVEGYRRPGNIHTFWGGAYHSAIETYDRARIAGASKEDALDEALNCALCESGQYEVQDYKGDWVPYQIADETPPDINGRWVPWGSQWVSGWRCTDEGPLLKSGPNKGQPDPRRRCANAKQDNEGAVPPMCPACGKPVVETHGWKHEDEAKNRHTLLRAVVWYVDEQPEEGAVQPYVFPDGRPGVEVSFQVPLPLPSPDGEPYILCGHIDSFAQFGEEVGPRERKSTMKTLGPWYFDRYSPDIQIDTYDLVSTLLFPDIAAKWVMLEATQTSAGFAKFQRQFIYNTEGRRAEHLQDTMYWIKRAEADAQAGYYPQNKASCYAHGGCPFREICNTDPSTRESWLKSRYVVNKWNPLRER